MARLYKEGDEGESACPGESDCPTFQSSADDQPREARCPSCPRRAVSTGSDSDRVEDAGSETFDEELLLDRVDRFRQERNSGRAVYEWMTPIEWEALLIWDEILGAYKRAHEVRLAQSMSALMAAMMR